VQVAIPASFAFFLPFPLLVPRQDMERKFSLTRALPLFHLSKPLTQPSRFPRSSQTTWAEPVPWSSPSYLQEKFPSGNVEFVGFPSPVRAVVRGTASAEVPLPGSLWRPGSAFLFLGAPDGDHGERRRCRGSWVSVVYNHPPPRLGAILDVLQQKQKKQIAPVVQRQLLCEPSVRFSFTYMDQKAPHSLGVSSAARSRPPIELLPSPAVPPSEVLRRQYACFLFREF